MTVSTLVHGPITRSLALDCGSFISAKVYSGDVEITFIHYTPEEIYASADHLRSLAMELESFAAVQEKREEVPA